MQMDKPDIGKLRETYLILLSATEDERRHPLYKRMLKREHKITTELVQMRRDTVHWNTSVRKPDESPIEIDDFVNPKDVEWLEMVSKQTRKMLRRLKAELGE